ncbi:MULTISPECIES: RodZ domain-containing protein [unclassified Marinimicrobium]|jgi:cytoskeleton protein RodZ|uniref:RodZ domain-containing protein n=1 Tax=Marinimicrobium TaxID=359337 RepID=UPI000C6C28F1|nr:MULTISPECIES: RodZ domain-containing protein [unclassified Marinimicrobium]MAN50760.1 hypothetical protein [Marinimicrobium sp.]
MSTEEQPAEAEVPELAPEAYPGALLKAAREKAKLSEEDVARELRMTVSKVRALEADDYDRLHSDTFIRGYLRTYAKLLGLEPEDLLQAYKQARRQAGLADDPEESPLKINVPEPTRSLWKFVLWILVLLAGIWALSVWFLGNRQDPVADSAMVDPISELKAPAPTSALTEEPAVEQEAVAGSVDDGTEEATEAAPTASAETNSAAALTGSEPPAASSGAVEPLAATEVSSPGASMNDPEVLDQLRLTFSEECWVEVTDSRGDVLETDLLQPGRELLLSGEAPFTVKLGNAGAAQVELNGERFDFVPPVSGRLMTLTVN